MLDIPGKKSKSYLEITTNASILFKWSKTQVSGLTFKVLENFQNCMNYNGAHSEINSSPILRLTLRANMALLEQGVPLHQPLLDLEMKNTVWFKTL